MEILMKKLFLALILVTGFELKAGESTGKSIRDNRGKNGCWKM